MKFRGCLSVLTRENPCIPVSTGNQEEFGPNRTVVDRYCSRQDPKHIERTAIGFCKRFMLYFSKIRLEERIIAPLAVFLPKENLDILRVPFRRGPFKNPVRAVELEARRLGANEFDRVFVAKIP